MSIDQVAESTAQRLKSFVRHTDLEDEDVSLAAQALRLLEQPLRMVVFGTDPKHAISLVNLMVGESLIPSNLPVANIRLKHDTEPHAKIQRQDGEKQLIRGAEFSTVFEGKPAKTQICVDLPVLKKISVLLVAQNDAMALHGDLERWLSSADIVLWAGGEPSMPVMELWRSMHEQLRSHSYLVLSPNADPEAWRDFAPEFADLLYVDPRRAHAAKTRKGGVDKAAFKDAGGTVLVKTIKKEIDQNVQFGIDAAELLFARHADAFGQANLASPPSKADAEPSNKSDAKKVRSLETDNAEVELERAEERAKAIERVLTRSTREQNYSVPLGKVATRSRGLLF